MGMPDFCIALPYRKLALALNQKDGFAFQILCKSHAAIP